MPSTGLRVKELLKVKGWTTKFLAEKTGMSESYLTHLKNGTRRWNEDALKKIALAFDMDPIALINPKNNLSWPHSDYEPQFFKQHLPEQPKPLPIKLIKLPILPSLPSRSKDAEIATHGNKLSFLPVLAQEDLNNAFCFLAQDNIMAPKIFKGDYLIICPQATTNNGDLVAVQYKTDKIYKNIMIINYSGNFIMLESVGHKHPPIALMPGRDEFNIIGRVMHIYQKFP